MKPPSISASRGARRLLDRLLWYGRRYGHIHPSQKQLGRKLGLSGRDVSDSMVRSYLRELKPFVEVQQGGDGHTASYFFTADLPSELTSGLLPGCFRAEMSVARRDPSTDQQVTDKNFRAESAQFSSSGSSCSGNDQSESTVQERQEPTIAEIEPSPYEKAQTAAIAEAVRACGFEPTPDLIAKLERKRRHYGVTGFRVAAAIARAFKLVEGTSNTPQRLPWFTTVVENALRHAEGPAVKQHGAAGEMPVMHHPQRALEPPAPAIPDLPTPVRDRDVDAAQAISVDPGTTWEVSPEAGMLDQVDGVAAAADQNPTDPAQPADPPPTPCPQCDNFGVRPLPTDPNMCAWCECARGAERRAIEPGFVDKVNDSVLKLRAMSRSATMAAVNRLPPRRGPQPIREFGSAAAVGSVR